MVEITAKILMGNSRRSRVENTAHEHKIVILLCEYTKAAPANLISTWSPPPPHSNNSHACHGLHTYSRIMRGSPVGNVPKIQTAAHPLAASDNRYGRSKLACNLLHPFSSVFYRVTLYIPRQVLECPSRHVNIHIHEICLSISLIQYIIC